MHGPSVNMLRGNGKSASKIHRAATMTSAHERKPESLANFKYSHYQSFAVDMTKPVTEPI
jgi:hypothetical protein